MELQALLFGFGWGFLLCFTFGPVFFAIIQISIDSSYKKGIAMATGVIAGDALLMFFAVFGTTLLPQINHFNEIIGASGALLLLVMGILSFFSSHKQLIYPTTRIGNFFFFLSKGTILNLLNPANFLFVVSTSAYLKGVLNYNISEIVVFFASSLVATFTAEVLIAIYSSKIKKAASTKVIKVINRIAGTVFIVIALRMLWSQFSYIFK